MDKTYMFFSCAEHEPGTVETMFKATGTIEDLFARRYDLIYTNGYLNKHSTFETWHIAIWNGNGFTIIYEAVIRSHPSQNQIYEEFVTPDEEYIYTFDDLGKVTTWEGLQAFKDE